MDQFFEELKRRNVVRVGIAYVVFAWLLLQVAELLSSIQVLPEWIPRILFIVLAIGFVAALVLAWIYEFTEQGLQRDSEVQRTEAPRFSRRQLDFAIMGLLAVALGYMLVDRFVLDITPGGGVEKSIAVLPFENRSELAGDAHFVDGIHDDILTQLANLSGLDKVISRTSVEQYRDTTKSMIQIGEELDVAHILEGGVQRAGDRVRINMQLISSASDEHLWAQTYDRELTVENLFAMQSEIAREIVVALRGVLSDRDDERLDTVPTTSLEAYGEYVLGREELAKRDIPALEKAVAHFSKAIELDPDYALAFVGLADSTGILTFQKGEDREESAPERQAAIDKALALDPLLGEAWASLGLLKNALEEFEEAEQHFLRAIELSPNYASAWQWYSHTLSLTKRFDEALVVLRKAIELDPLAGILKINLVDHLSRKAQHEEALEVLRKGVALDPGFRLYYRYLPWELGLTGRLGEALHWIRAARVRFPDNPEFRGSECDFLAALAYNEEAEACFLVAEEGAPDPFGLIEVYRQRGDYGKALELAREAVQEDPNPWVKEMLAWAYLETGLFDDARVIAEEISAEFFGDGELIIESPSRALQAAYLLQAEGRRSRADAIYDKVLAGLEASSRTGRDGYGFLDVGLHVFRGDRDAAFAALREAIDSGWRHDWWYLQLPYGDLHSDPEWIALMAELEADIAAQREWYEEHRDDPLL